MATILKLEDLIYTKTYQLVFILQAIKLSGKPIYQLF